MDAEWLQGKEAVPEAVDHVLVPVDPREDRSWLQSQPAVSTDNAHRHDSTGPSVDSAANWSEAVKRLKPRVLQRLIDAHKCGTGLLSVNVSCMAPRLGRPTGKTCRRDQHQRLSIDSIANWSEAVKRLKLRVLQRLIDDAYMCGARGLTAACLRMDVSTGQSHTAVCPCMALVLYNSTGKACRQDSMSM